MSLTFPETSQGSEGSLPKGSLPSWPAFLWKTVAVVVAVVVVVVVARVVMVFVVEVVAALAVRQEVR